MDMEPEIKEMKNCSIFPKHLPSELGHNNECLADRHNLHNYIKEAGKNVQNTDYKNLQETLKLDFLIGNLF
jgi:hypothetical protein